MFPFLAKGQIFSFGDDVAAVWKLGSWQRFEGRLVEMEVIREKRSITCYGYYKIYLSYTDRHTLMGTGRRDRKTKKKFVVSAGRNAVSCTWKREKNNEVGNAFLQLPVESKQYKEFNTPEDKFTLSGCS